MSGVEKLVNPTDHDVQRTLEILLEAFAQDPIIRAHGGFDADVLSDLLSWRITYGSPSWETYVFRSPDGRIEGCGLVKPAGQTMFDGPEETMGRMDPVIRAWLEGEHGAAQKTLDMKCFGPDGLTPTLYLYLLAVHSSARGQGIAPKILAGLQDVAREQKVPFSLNTEYDRLRLYYEKLGFTTLGSVIMPVTPEGQTIESWEMVYRAE